MRKNIVRIVIAAGILVPAVTVAAWWIGHGVEEARTYTVKTGNVIAGVTVSGTIQCTEQPPVAAEILAVVTKLHVRKGQVVTAGQELIQLDDRSASAQCAIAAAKVELARRHLADLQAGARKEELAKADADLKQAEFDLAYAKKRHDELARAMESGTTTESAVDLAANELKKAQTQVDWAEANRALLRAGARPEQVAAARAQVALAQEELARCEIERTKYVLRSSCSGEITERDVDVGEVVQPGRMLLRVNNVGAVQILAHVQESQMHKVNEGDRARIVSDGFAGTVLHAKVDKKLARVDPERGTVSVVLELTEPATVRLKDNGDCDVTVVHEERENVLLIPAEAISRVGGKAYVRVRSGSSFERREIVPGITDGYLIEVKSGLEAGDVVRLPQG